MRRFVLTLRAQRQLAAAMRWWVFHRDKAPDAFKEDFAETAARIADRPAIGHLAHTRRPGIRRVLMERIRYYLYYRVNASGDVEVLSVWHASRRPPRL